MPTAPTSSSRAAARDLRLVPAAHRRRRRRGGIGRRATGSSAAGRLRRGSRNGSCRPSAAASSISASRFLSSVMLTRTAGALGGAAGQQQQHGIVGPIGVAVEQAAQRARHRCRDALLGQALEMKGQRLLGQPQRVLGIRSDRDAAGQIGKGDREIVLVLVFAASRDSAPPQAPLTLMPAAAMTWATTASGRLHLWFGRVTRPGALGMGELDQRAALFRRLPAGGFEGFEKLLDLRHVSPLRPARSARAQGFASGLTWRECGDSMKYPR